jgi:hypothetical protein
MQELVVLVLGQQIEHVVRLTWADVSITEDLASVTLGRTSIALPDPLDGPLRRIADEPRRGQTAAHPATAWIFRGRSPGQHIAAAHLRNRIKPAPTPSTSPPAASWTDRCSPAWFPRNSTVFRMNESPGPVRSGSRETLRGPAEAALLPGPQRESSPFSAFRTRRASPSSVRSPASRSVGSMT